MTRRIILILFLLPFLANAQFRISVQAINIEDHSEISNVQVSLGRTDPIAFNSNYEFNQINVKHLVDTLFIRHGNFRFENQALLSNEYSVKGNLMEVIVYGFPWKKNQINIDLDIAKSKKVKNDSVTIEWNHDGPNSVISFKPSFENKKNKSAELNPFRRAYDDLMDGEFVIINGHSVKTVPFQKENWTQLACLNLPEKIVFQNRELSILSQYFEHLKESKREQELMEYAHQRQIDSLQSEIDELNREIDRLNGIPVAYRPIYPEPVLEQTAEEVYFFVQNDALPTGGYEVFASSVKEILGDMMTKYCGNITLEVIVQKDGRIRTKVLHAAEDKTDVVERLRYHLHQQRWEPAISQGRVLETSTIINLNIGVSK